MLTCAHVVRAAKKQDNYGNPLDFALERARERYDFRAYLAAIRSEFAGER